MKRLIPQRHPFIMVDTLEPASDLTAGTTLAVRPDNYFMLPDGTLAETGLIEHIAQSCSALAGYRALKATSETADAASGPPVGIIGEVKHFVCHRRPSAGECVSTTINFDMSFGNVTMATGRSFVSNEPIAEINLKIFMQ